jgi:hypothetical protein
MDNSGMTLQSSFWLYEAHDGDWRLVLVTPLVDTNGPLAAYSQVQRILRESNLIDRLPLRKIFVASPNLPLVRLMRTAIRTGPGIGAVRFTRNAINNVMIEGALIYRML